MPDANIRSVVLATGLLVAAAPLLGGCGEGVSPRCSFSRVMSVVIAGAPAVARLRCQGEERSLLVQIETGPSTNGWTEYGWVDGSSIEESRGGLLQFLVWRQMFASPGVAEATANPPGDPNRATLTLTLKIARDVPDGTHTFADRCLDAGPCPPGPPSAVSATFAPVGLGAPTRLAVRSGKVTLARSRDVPFVDVGPGALVNGRTYKSTLTLTDLELDGEVETSACGATALHIGPLSMTVFTQATPNSCISHKGNLAH